ncbi:MAG: hypothetical protein IJM88_05555 [Bacteroidales bacterium]|nr:hypothetical protein [Bacteroidales bacterium]
MKIKHNERCPYVAPQLTVVSIHVEQGFAGSNLLNTLLLTGWGNGGDPWSGDSPASNYSMGGWTDNGADAWQ